MEMRDTQAAADWALVKVPGSTIAEFYGQFMTLVVTHVGPRIDGLSTYSRFEQFVRGTVDIVKKFSDSERVAEMTDADSDNLARYLWAIATGAQEGVRV